MFSWQTRRSIAKAVLTKKSPYYIQYYITGRCNLMCRQCNIVETNSRVTEMDLDRVKFAAKNLRKIGAGIVLLTGGEPFMRKDLPQIVQAFVSNGMNVRLQTAGTKFATEEQLQACYDAGARDINVSVDSLEFDKFDYINAVPGSAKNAIETIERISKIFRRQSSVLSFGTVMSRFNYLEIPSIVEFAQRIGWYVSIVPVHISSKEMPKGFRSFDRLFNFQAQDYPQLDAVCSKLKAMKRSGSPIFDSERFIESSVSFLKGAGPTWRKNGVCDSPNLYFAIRPNGAMSTCCDYTLAEPPYVYDDSFVENYKSGRIQARGDIQDIVKNCGGCHYGSYPEVTISVRDPRAFAERVLMVLKSGRGRLAHSPIQSDFIAEVERIRAKNSDVYPSASWMSQEIQAKVAMWNQAEGRKAILMQDRRDREEQNRMRGVGPDVLIGAEEKLPEAGNGTLRSRAK
jgi:MoaA/NifB/PqqE/SkfB family radical SAM enzyme